MTDFDDDAQTGTGNQAELFAYIARRQRSAEAQRDAERTLDHEEAAELGLDSTDAATGAAITVFAASGAQHNTGAIAITPDLSIVGGYIFDGMPSGTVTCIDPEAEHQELARHAFRRRGIPTSRSRFLTSRPLDVLSRMAAGNYHLIYADVDPIDASALIKTALPLLSPGGSLLLAGSLLDGTLADTSRTDRATEAARAAEDELDQAEGFVICRLALGAGMTVATRLL